MPTLLQCAPPNTQAADWRDQAILQFRIMRKRALRQTLEKLAAKLGLDAAGNSSAGAASSLEGQRACYVPSKRGNAYAFQCHFGRPSAACLPAYLWHPLTWPTAPGASCYGPPAEDAAAELVDNAAAAAAEEGSEAEQEDAQGTAAAAAEEEAAAQEDGEEEEEAPHDEF